MSEWYEACPIRHLCAFLDEWCCPFEKESDCHIDTCPRAPILKLLAEAKEMDDFQGAGFGKDSDGWEYFSFRIRR